MTTTPTPETTTTTGEPAAWIGCLSCYNNGQLRGKWITAQQAAEEMGNAETDRAITYAGQGQPAHYPSGRTYIACRVCGGDEFDVFDTEHLPTKMTAAEFYKNAETLAELDAETLERLTTLAGFLGMENLAELITYDENNYAGQWDTFQEYAENFAQDTGDLAGLPERLAYYFNFEKYARDLAYSYLHDETTGHTWHSA